MPLETQASDPTATVWNAELQRMSELARASGQSDSHYPLAALALLQLRRARQSLKQEELDNPLEVFKVMIEELRQQESLKTDALVGFLSVGLRALTRQVLQGWLKIARESPVSAGFPTWFLSKLDDLALHGRHDTPTAVCQLAASVFKDRPPESVYDPACGTGGFLLAMAQRFPNARLIGRETSPEALAWAQLRFLVCGDRAVELLSGTPFAEPGWAGPSSSASFDAILTNPPFAMRLPDIEGFGPRSSGMVSEVAAIHHAIARLSDGGRAAIVVPMGVLFRGGQHQELRKFLVHHDLLQAVLGLPERLFAPGTAIETALLFIGRGKSNHQKGRVLFIDARSLGTRDGARALLSDGAVKRIEGLLERWEVEAGLSRVVAVDRLDQGDMSFVPARYIERSAPERRQHPDARLSSIEKADTLHNALTEEYDRLRAELVTRKPKYDLSGDW